MIRPILCSLALVMASPASAQETTAQNEFSFYQLSSPTVGSTLSAARKLVIRSANGQTAEIDFGGPTVTYSGTLPVDAAARLFFDAVFNLRPDCTKETPR